jgi:hypothetical protein
MDNDDCARINPVQTGCEAMAINNSEDPIVVGLTKIDAPCSNELVPPSERSMPFQITFDLGALSDVTLVDPDDLLDTDDEDSGPDELSGRAMDVNTAATILVGGWSDGCNIEKTDDCQGESRDPMSWLATSPDISDHIEEFNSEVRGLNDDGMMVGYADDGELDCLRIPTVWETAGGDNLELTMANIGDEGHANAINEVYEGLVRVVGLNRAQGTAQLWLGVFNSGSGHYNWTPLNLNDVHEIAIDNPCPPFCPGWTTVVEAYDVNNNNWMVGWGLYEPESNPLASEGSYVRAFLIRPSNFCGPADIFPVEGGDCEVGSGDLAELLAQAIDESCEECPPLCSADFNHSCDIGPEDLAQLLAAWGRCDECELLGEEESLTGEDGQSMSLAETLGVLGFTTAQDFIAAMAEAQPEDLLLWQLLLDAAMEED